MNIIIYYNKNVECRYIKDLGYFISQKFTWGKTALLFANFDVPIVLYATKRMEILGLQRNSRDFPCMFSNFSLVNNTMYVCT